MPFDEELDPPPPTPAGRTTVLGALRPAVVDFYFQSIRLVPANLLWGVLLVVIAWVALSVGPWLGIVAAPLLGPPLVGIYRLAAQITRGEETVLSDVRSAMRERFLPSLILAAGLTWAVVLLVVNILTGLDSASPVGLAFAIASGWTLVVAITFGVIAWPLLGDPRRRDEPLRSIARLAGYLLLAAPVRLVALAIVVTILGVVSTVLFVAVVTISVAFVALLSCRVVLPEADRLAEHLEARRSG